MAEAIVAIVAEGLGNLIIQQGKFLIGVSHQVKLAQIELHLIGSFLKDADSRQGDEQLVRICVKLIRDAAYDLEDVIESFAFKLASKSRKGAMKIVLKRFACIFNGVHRYKIGSQIEDIMTELSHLKSSLQSYNIRQISGSEGVTSSFQRHRHRRLTHAHDIVGLDENTSILVKDLLSQKWSWSSRVVSIWGMGGSGKSTLAKGVFHQIEVRSYFDCFAWVRISQQWEGRAVLQEVLIQLISPTQNVRKEIEKMKKHELAEQVCRIQRERKCLVVLDDIWSQEAWNSIEDGFPIDEPTESRILLTTRNKEVALLASRNNDFLHKPQALNEMQSWELFENIALRGTGTDNRGAKEEFGNKMLVHCSGLPLAISELAGHLKTRETIGEWNTVLGNVDVYIMKGINVLGRENTGQEYGGVSAVLALSYDDLPSHLKLCFLYLAQFPEDHEIPVKRLTQLWIAEGFITSMSEIYGSLETIEEVAYGCLIKLVERSMVQVVKYGSSGKVKTCNLHDLMRHLCLQIAEQENFLRVVNFSSGPISKTTLIGKVRRLALHLDEKDKDAFLGRDGRFLGRDGRDCHIRSLLCFAPKHFLQKWNKKVMPSVFNDFKLLRVLKFEKIGGGFELPEMIGNLVHLRFLSLKDSAFGGLPSCVSNLVLLQILDLRGSDLSYGSCYGFKRKRVIKITNVFRNMEQLRHLYLPSEHTVSEKLSFATLCNLQTLVNVSLEKCDLKGLVQLTNMKKLFIIGSKSAELEKLKDMLKSRSITFNHLQSLSVMAPLDYCNEHTPGDILLNCPHLYKLRLERVELPNEPMCYPNLTKIMLSNTNLKDEHIQILEKMPNLRVLYLSGVMFEKLIVFSHGGFPHLETLYLRHCDRLEEWWMVEGAMPELNSLHILNCSKLKEVPKELQCITTLKELSIDHMPTTFCMRVREGGEDFYKIKHVPFCFITNDQFKVLEMEEVAGASQLVVGDPEESTMDAPPPDEETGEIQAASTP